MHTIAIDTRDCDTVAGRLDLVTAETDDDLLVFVEREIATIHDGDHFEFHYDDGGAFVTRATEDEHDRGFYDLVDVESGRVVDSLTADEYGEWAADGTITGLELVN